MSSSTKLSKTVSSSSDTSCFLKSLRITVIAWWHHNDIINCYSIIGSYLICTLNAEFTSSLLLPTAAPALAYRRNNPNKWVEISFIWLSRDGSGILMIQTRHCNDRESTLMWREPRDLVRRGTKGSNIPSCSSDEESNFPLFSPIWRSYMHKYMYAKVNTWIDRYDQL
jgi:hypothetical protein